MNTQIMKPMTVARHEFVCALTDLVNNSQLPAFVLEDVLKGVYHDIRMIAKQQLEKDIQAYQETLRKTGEN